MKKLFYLLTLVFLMTSCYEDNTPLELQKNIEQELLEECDPTSVILDNSKAYLSPNNLIEGDIIPDKRYNQKGFVSGDVNRVWKNGIIPYYYKKEDRSGQYVQLGFDEQEQAIIDSTIQEIDSNTVLTFVKFESREALLAEYEDGVIIVPSFIGSSHLGRQGGIQKLSLTFPSYERAQEARKQMVSNLVGQPYYNLDNTSQKRTTRHEIGHLASMQHEHTRPDRDEHIQLFEENIGAGILDQFTAREGRVCTPYQVKSIMHYPSEAGVTEEGLFSMLTLEGEIIESNNIMLESDYATINAFYEDEI